MRKQKKKQECTRYLQDRKKRRKNWRKSVTTHKNQSVTNWGTCTEGKEKEVNYNKKPNEYKV